MRKKRFLLNTLIITSTSFFLKVVGMFFRIYLSNAIGAEGMGLYQLIFSVYVLAISLSSAGVSVAVTRIISEQTGPDGGRISHQVILRSIFYVLLLSAIVSGGLFFCAEWVCRTFINDMRAVVPLKILCAALPFIGCSACFKGYFTARDKVSKVSISQILEDLLKIILIVSLLGVFAGNGLVVACIIVMSAIALSEAASCAFLYASYRKDIGKNARPYERCGISVRLFTLILTLAVGTIAGSGLHTAENMLIPAGLLKFGMARETALAKYGMLRGMTMPVLLFPSALLSAFSTLLVPEITRAGVLNQKRTINYTISRVFQITLIPSIFIMGVFMVFSRQIGLAIYNNAEVGDMIRLLAPFIPFMYLDSSIFAILTGLDEQKSVLRITLVDSILRVLFIYTLVPRYGFDGIIFTMYLSNIITPVVGTVKLIKKTGVSLNAVNWIVKPAAAVGFSAFAAIFFLNRFDVGGNAAQAVWGFLIMFFIYLLTLKAAAAYTHDDVVWLFSLFKQNKKRTKLPQ